MLARLVFLCVIVMRDAFFYYVGALVGLGVREPAEPMLVVLVHHEILFLVNPLNQIPTTVNQGSRLIHHKVHTVPDPTLHPEIPTALSRIVSTKKIVCRALSALLARMQ